MPAPMTPIASPSAAICPHPSRPRLLTLIEGIIKIVTRQATICEVSPFGTTENQYDIYYGVVWGTRTAFFVGIIITAANVFIGLLPSARSAPTTAAGSTSCSCASPMCFLAFPFLVAAVTMAAVLARQVRLQRRPDDRRDRPHRLWLDGLRPAHPRGYSLDPRAGVRAEPLRAIGRKRDRRILLRTHPPQRDLSLRWSSRRSTCGHLCAQLRRR
jgi:hypothetical protein